MAAPKIHIIRDEPTPHPPTTTATAVERYQHGWRSGKPVEDPEKLKRWGFVGAKPSEYLVVTRRGQIDRKRSGQGARVFKWPWHAVAIVPTTLQRIEFTADQVTRERVGVAVTGVAVFRIAEPLLAFRVLNFTFPEAAAEKLAETLREMFVGAARRLIANLSLDECLTRRKETIAGYLMDEIAPVVGGEGSPDDATTKGWGVVIDTIEIQDVKIQSQQVFAHLQAPYRAEIAARAEQAQLENQRATRTLKARTEAEATEVESREAARRAEMNAAAAVAAMEAERTRVEASQRAQVRELDHQRAIELGRQDAEHERARKQADLALELRRHEAETRDQEQQLEIAHQRRLAEIEQLLAQQRTLRDLVTHALPEIARALQHSFGTVHYTQIGGDGSGGPLAAVPSALAQLLSLARSFGLELPHRE